MDGQALPLLIHAGSRGKQDGVRAINRCTGYYLTTHHNDRVLYTKLHLAILTST